MAKHRVVDLSELLMVPREEVIGATAQLRHLYKQMIRPSWTDAQVAEAARGLLGPAIARLERAVLTLAERKVNTPT